MSTARARRLRRAATDAERGLWLLLRDRRLCGLKFRRQHQIGRYVVDFCCVGRRLIIEVDGSQHAYNVAADATRTAYLNRHGYRVVRFWNSEVLSESEAVLAAIAEAAGIAPL